MEKEQEPEWSKAQSTGISIDLVAAAKKQLQFLAVVDRNRYLNEGPTLKRAIYRYNACWLPLLAKHSDSQVSEGPLVVPLDCEWIWHCHRLNPVGLSELFFLLFLVIFIGLFVEWLSFVAWVDGFGGGEEEDGYDE